MNSYTSTVNRANRPYVGTPVPKMTPIGRKSLINYDRLRASSQIENHSPSISFNERASFDCDLSDEDDISLATNFGPKNLLEVGILARKTHYNLTSLNFSDI